MKKLIYICMLVLLWYGSVGAAVYTKYVNKDCALGAGCDGSSIEAGYIWLEDGLTAMNSPTDHDTPSTSVLYVKQGTQDLNIAGGFTSNNRYTVHACDASGNPVDSGVILNLTDGAAFVFSAVATATTKQGIREFHGITFSSNGGQPTGSLISITSVPASGSPQASSFVFDHCTFTATALTKDLILAAVTSGREPNLTFTNCDFTGVTFNGDGFDFIETQGVADFTFTNNTVTVANDDSKVLNLNTTAPSTDGFDLTITGNTITSTVALTDDDHYIYNIYGLWDAIDISDNNFSITNAAAASGMIRIQTATNVSFDSLLVEGNTFTDTGQTARAANNYLFQVYNGGTASTGDLIVRNNKFQSYATSGYVVCMGTEASSSTYDNKMDGLIFEKNRVIGTNDLDTTSASTHGVFISYQDDFIIRNNYISGGPYGVLPKTNNTCTTGGQINNNVITNFGGTPAYAAVGLTGGSDVTIANNTIYTRQTSASGIRLATGTVSCTFDGTNNLVEKTAHGIVDNAPIEFTVLSAGVGGISALTTYIAIVGADPDTFGVEATVGSGAIDITEAGTETGTYAEIDDECTATVLVKNNIVDGKDGNALTRVEAGSEGTFTNNIYYNDAGANYDFYYQGISKTFAQWQALNINGTNTDGSDTVGSMTADPKLSDATGGDFWLTHDSPARGVGADLGTEADYLALTRESQIGIVYVSADRDALVAGSFPTSVPWMSVNDRSLGETPDMYLDEVKDAGRLALMYWSSRGLSTDWAGLSTYITEDMYVHSPYSSTNSADRLVFLNTSVYLMDVQKDSWQTASASYLAGRMVDNIHDTYEYDGVFIDSSQHGVESQEFAFVGASTVEVSLPAEVNDTTWFAGMQEFLSEIHTAIKAVDPNLALISNDAGGSTHDVYDTYVNAHFSEAEKAYTDTERPARWARFNWLQNWIGFVPTVSQTDGKWDIGAYKYNYLDYVGSASMRNIEVKSVDLK